MLNRVPDLLGVPADPPLDVSQPPNRSAGWFDWRGFAWAVVLSICATAIGWPLYHTFGLANTHVLMLYLLVVLWVAGRYSRGAAILASVLGVALFDFCFVTPYYRFTVADQQYLVTFAAMMVAAVVISTLTHRVRAQADAARERERRTAAMYALTRDLAAARGTDDVAAATVKHMADVLQARTVLFLPNGERRLVARSDSDGGAPVAETELAAAQGAFERGHPSDVPDTGLFLPLRSSRGTVGVIGIIRNEPVGFGESRRQLAETLAAQGAVAIERALLAEEARQAWERVEAEFLRNTLLSGVSHELRTPLAAIIGAASTVTEANGRLSSDATAEMLETILAEAERMERLVTNLLDMTRMEAGGLVLQREWQPVQEVIGSALHHLDRRLRGRAVKTDLPPHLPLVQIDTVAIEQVVTNFIDNAVEYTPPGTAIEIIARAGDGSVSVEVADHGPGLPPGTEQRVFEKFFRVRNADNRRGIGLGLAIARGIVEAHGGQISAANRARDGGGGAGGAIFRFTLPLVGPPPEVDASK